MKGVIKLTVLSGLMALAVLLVLLPLSRRAQGGPAAKDIPLKATFDAEGKILNDFGAPDAEGFVYFDMSGANPPVFVRIVGSTGQLWMWVQKTDRTNPRFVRLKLNHKLSTELEDPTCPWPYFVYQYDPAKPSFYDSSGEPAVPDYVRNFSCHTAKEFIEDGGKLVRSNVTLNLLTMGTISRIVGLEVDFDADDDATFLSTPLTPILNEYYERYWLFPTGFSEIPVIVTATQFAGGLPVEWTFIPCGSQACDLFSIDTKAKKPVPRCSRGVDGTFNLPFVLKVKKL
jgi:hypothetical protein